MIFSTGDMGLGVVEGRLFARAGSLYFWAIVPSMTEADGSFVEVEYYLTRTAV